MGSLLWLNLIMEDWDLILQEFCIVIMMESLGQLLLRKSKKAMYYGWSSIRLELWRLWESI